MELRYGFTLIELLIVVAIIAILAAIAVPNMLEARTRAKVAAATSEMRTVGVALESFRIDHSDYPSRTDMAILPSLRRLTTPIAYITEVPDDPFADTIENRYSPIDWSLAYKSRGSFIRPYPFDYLVRTSMVADWKPITSRPNTARWALRSIGPAREPIWLGFPDTESYDPSNGTISAGIIIMTGPGLRLDQPNKE